MMHFKKIDNPDFILVHTIFANTVHYTISENFKFFSWQDCKPESAEVVYRTLQDSPSILYTLAQQIFLENNKSWKDRKKSFQLPLFLSQMDFIKNQNLLYTLFRSPCAFQVEHPIHGTLWQINTNGATMFGEEIFERMHKDGALPPEINKIFYKKFVVSDVTELGMYKITAEQTDFISASASPFFQNFCTDDTLRSLDISALSLEDCAVAHFLKYLLQQKKQLYFYTEAHRFSNKRVSKHLFWEGICD